ncbi:MAG: FBP domain-containing protein, partial [Pseudomonadales bacterium]|nr:FBP domain-containing protein [Pseudomonadales bacterium]
EEDMPLPDLGTIDWDVLDYLGWIHPDGHIGYLVVISPTDGSVKGVSMRRSRFTSGKRGFEMCSLCHHVHSANGTAMFTIAARKNGHRHYIGNVVCKDLDCSLRLRNLVNPPSYLNETLYPEAKIWRMQLALHKWLRSADRL